MKNIHFGWTAARIVLITPLLGVAWLGIKAERAADWLIVSLPAGAKRK